MRREERVVLPRRGATTVACGAGSLRLSTSADGGVELSYDEGAFEVLLEVTRAIELRDGDLVCAGRQWLCFEAGRPGRAPRLHLLDPMGDVHMTMTIRTESWTLGREAGDVTLPWDDELSDLHLQILVRGGTTFIQSLAEGSGTWVLVRPGEVVPRTCTLGVGDRVLRVCAAAPLPAPSHDTAAPEPDGGWCTRIYAAA